MSKTKIQIEALLKVNKAKRLSTENWIQKAKEVHGDKFDYSVTVYTTARDKLEIICPEHGKSLMLPHHHIKGHGCPDCGKEAINKNRKLTQQQFLDRIKIIPGLSFEKTIYKNKRSKVIVTCLEHGDYTTTAEVLLKGCGCPKCKSSFGEKQIREYLNCINIFYFEQQTFKGLKLKRDLYYDFYIPSLNLCIEYDGLQHFKSVKYFGGNTGYRRIQKSDEIKTQYCKENNINLLRIKYDENIHQKLEEFLN